MPFESTEDYIEIRSDEYRVKYELLQKLNVRLVIQIKAGRLRKKVMEYYDIITLEKMKKRINKIASNEILANKYSNGEKERFYVVPITMVTFDGLPTRVIEFEDQRT